MLCYRCGSYNPDGLAKCSECGESFSGRRTTGRTPELAVGGGPKNVPPFDMGHLVGKRYRIVEPIAQGASGWVLRARDEEVDVDVAIKVISANLLQTDEDRKVFLKAVSRARRITHPNVVRIYDEGTDGPYIYYTAPYLEGLSLRKVIDLRAEKRQTFSMEELLPLLTQLADAVDTLGKYGPHGTLRPGNVLVLPDLLKVTGIAHFKGLPHRPFVALHKGVARRFLAPEAVASKEGLDRRADVYSLGVIVGEMYCGVVYGSDAAAWKEAMAELRPEMVRVLERAVAENPDDRFASAREFFDSLVEVSGIDPSTLAHGRRRGTAAHELAVLDDESTSDSGIGDIAIDMGAEASGIMDDDVTTVEGRPTRPTIELGPENRKRKGPPPPPSDVSPPKSSPPLVLDPTANIRDSGLHRRPPSSLGGKRRRPTGSQKRATGPQPRPGAKKSNGALWLAAAIVLAAFGVSAAMWWRHHLQQVQGPGDDTFVREVPKPPETVEPPKSDADRGQDQPKEMSPKDEGAKPAVKEPPKETKSTPKVTPKVVDSAPKTVDTSPPPPPPPPKLVVASSDHKDQSSHQANTAVAKGCPSDMIEISATTFEQGSKPGDPMRGFGDLSARKRKVASYCIDVFEYPNQRGRDPGTSVSWAKAKSLCEKKGRRLCSEAEWENACKGPQNLRFASGNDHKPGVCNTGAGQGVLRSGAKGACKSGYGVFDLSGNAAEWTSSRWSADIPDKVVKGGASDQAYYTARCAARSNESPGAKNRNLGFRCCKSF